MTGQHDRSRAQEQRIADHVGGRRMPASGAFWKHKGDVRGGRYLMEMKRTDNKRSISIKDEDLTKIRQEALSQGLTPLLGFELNGRDYFIVRKEDMFEDHTL